MRPDDRIRLRHMLEAIERAHQFVDGRDKGDLERDSQLLLALIKCIEIIGEAAAKISLDTQNQYPAIPWRQIVAMRNHLIHVYFDVNLNIIWKTVQKDLSELRVQLTRILDEAKD